MGIQVQQDIRIIDILMQQDTRIMHMAETLQTTVLTVFICLFIVDSPISD